MWSTHLPGAAEFPNDNPELHRGARWVCSATRGAARAILRYTGLDAAGLALPPPPSRSRRAPEAVAVVTPSAAATPKKERLESRLRGPLLLDLSRVVLPHRVDDIPPPPDFIFEPFVPSPMRAALPGLDALPAAPPAPPLIPIPCRVIGERVVRRSVVRGRRVDIAPCLSIGSAELSRVGASHVETEAELGRTEPSRVESHVALRAEKNVEFSRVEPSRVEFSRVEPRSRSVRRRGGIASRAVAPSPLPAADEVSRAIAELEAAFASPIGAGSPCFDRADLVSIGGA